MLSNKSLSISIAWYLLLFSLSLYMVSLVDVTHLLLNSFEEGEYLGVFSHIESYYHGESAFPLVIHGGMDFIPALLAKYIYGQDHLVVGTRLINAVIVALTWTFFLALFRRIILACKVSSWWLVLPVVFLWLVAIRLGDAISLHQTFLNPRDLFLVALVYSVLSYECVEDRFHQVIYLVFVGLTCSISLFWSYDRGLASLAFYSAFLVGLFFRKRLLDATIILLVAAIFIGIIDNSKLMGTMLEDFTNIKYWIEHAADWRLPYTVIRLCYAVPITALVLTSVVIFIRLIGKSPESIKLKWFWIGFFLLQILLLSSALKRPDSAHISWCIWPALLFFFYYAVHLVGNKCTIEIRWMKPFVLPRYFYFYTVAMLTCLVFYFFVPNNKTLPFIRNMIQPQQDLTFVSKEKVAVAKKLLGFDPHCFFGWTNDGEMAMLIGKPYCTQITYAIYASRSADRDLLFALKQSNPNVILFGEGNFPTNIVSNSMQTRLPSVSEYILKNYPHELVMGTYVIRQR
jgi:hypothetical protein